MSDQMSATEIVNMLSQAAPVPRALPALVKAIEYAASLEGAIAEGERTLASIQRDVETARAAQAEHDARERAEHIVVITQRSADVETLEHRVRDLASRRDTLAAEIEALMQQHADVTASLDRHQEMLTAASAGLRSRAAH